MSETLPRDVIPQLSVVDRVGSRALAVFELAGAIATFGAKAIAEAARPPYEAREVLRHAYEFGYRSAPLIMTAGVAVGVVLSMHTRASLERFGAESMIPAGLAIALSLRSWPVVAFLVPVVLIQLATAPLSAHMVGRQAYRNGTIDELEDRKARP